MGDDTKISAADPHPRKRLELLNSWMSYADTGAGDPGGFPARQSDFVVPVAQCIPHLATICAMRRAGPHRDGRVGEVADRHVPAG